MTYEELEEWCRKNLGGHFMIIEDDDHELIIYTGVKKQGFQKLIALTDEEVNRGA